MPRSSRHKSHKQSKHSSSKEYYSDSEEDDVVVKMKEKSRDESSVRVHRDSTSGEKRKMSSSQVPEGKDLSGHGNGQVLEYVSSKRRKEKSEVTGDRWNGGGDERRDGDRSVEKEMHKGESLKVDSKLKENSDKGESMRIESKAKSKRYESGTADERKEVSLVSVVKDKEDTKSKGEQKRKSDRDSSRKEGKESKDKEKTGFQESKSDDAEVKLLDIDVRKKQGPHSGDFIEERQGKRTRENSEHPAQDQPRNPELEKETEKRTRRRREGSSERDKYKDDSKEGDEKRLSARGDRAKDVKYRDDKHKDGSYADKHKEDGHKDDKRKDEKHREKADKDNKHQGYKHRGDGEKEAKHRDIRHHEEGDSESRRKDEKHRKDGERDSRRKDDKYQEVIEKDSRRDEKYREDGDRDVRHKDDRLYDDADKDIRQGGERYYEDGDRDDRRWDSKYKEDGNRDNRRKEEKYREDIEREVRNNDSKQGDDFDREKRLRDTKYRDENTSRHRSADKLDTKRSKDDGYAADNNSRISYDDSPTHDDRTVRYRDDQGRRRTIEKEDYGDIRSRGTRDQRSDNEKKSVSSARTDLVAERVRSTSKNVDIESSSSHSRRRSSPTSNSHAPRDQYRNPKQDELKYRDYNHEDRVRHNITPTRDYVGPIGGSERTSSRSLEKIGVKDDALLRELSAERRMKSDKSPSPSTDRRQFSRSDGKRSFDVEESTPRSGGSRDVKEYSDPDTLSVSSPYMRNNHFSSSSKSFAPPPLFRPGVESPSQFGSVEDDNRGKSNMRHRRFVDPNMGRIHGNAWRGVPSWPSPVGNGFMPFPPPPVGFPSVMQPFPSPSMFGVRPPMQLNHPSYPGRPMGWRNQGDDSYPPLHSWDASNAVFGDYGRSDWDHSRSGRGWETGGEVLKGPNRTASVEMTSSEKENNSARSADEAFADQSIQPAHNEQTLADQQVESTSVVRSTKSSEKNDVEAPLISLEETGAFSKMSRKDDVPLCHVYLSNIDISDDLTEPELFNKCTGLIDVDRCVFSDVEEAKIVFMEEAVEAKLASHTLPSTLCASTDNSIFQKSISLYKKLKENSYAGGGKIPKILSEFIPKDQHVENDNETEKALPTDNALPNFDKEEDPQNLQINSPLPNETEKFEEPISASNHVDMGLSSISHSRLEENDVDEKPLSDLPSKVEDVHANNSEEVKLLDTKCGDLLNTDVSFEAESVDLSWIHHSPESTH